VDNVPFAATMAPILKHMSEAFGFSLLPLIWSTALGTDIGGNGTPSALPPTWWLWPPMNG